MKINQTFGVGYRGTVDLWCRCIEILPDYTLAYVINGDYYIHIYKNKVAIIQYGMVVDYDSDLKINWIGELDFLDSEYNDAIYYMNSSKSIKSIELKTFFLKICRCFVVAKDSWDHPITKKKQKPAETDYDDEIPF